jgi:hypothetical protein
MNATAPFLTTCETEQVVFWLFLKENPSWMPLGQPVYRYCIVCGKDMHGVNWQTASKICAIGPSRYLCLSAQCLERIQELKNQRVIIDDFC